MDAEFMSVSEVERERAHRGSVGGAGRASSSTFGGIGRAGRRLKCGHAGGWADAECGAGPLAG